MEQLANSGNGNHTNDADQDFRKNAVDAGEIGAGHYATALYAVTFRPNANGRIATFLLH